MAIVLFYQLDTARFKGLCHVPAKAKLRFAHSEGPRFQDRGSRSVISPGYILRGGTLSAAL